MYNLLSSFSPSALSSQMKQSKLVSTATKHSSLLVDQEIDVQRLPLLIVAI